MNTALSVWPSANRELTGGFHSYLNYVYSIPALSAEEERELFYKYQEESDLSSVRKIVLSHLRFVAYVAKSYTGYGLPLEDLVQEGTVGLMKSVKQYDPNKGVRLASFAVYWIKSEIHEFVIKNWKLVKVATTKAQRKLFFNLRKLKKQIGWMSEEDVKEVAEYLDVETNDVLEMESRMHQMDSYFDTSFGDSNAEESDGHLASAKLLEDRSSSPEKIVLESDHEQRCNTHIKQFVSNLDDRTRDIIENRWFVDVDKKQGLKELSQKHGVSMERIRQLEKKALDRLKRYLVREGLYQD